MTLPGVEINPSTAFIRRISAKVTVPFVLLASLVFIAASAIISKGGMLQFEMDARMPAHLSGQPLSTLLFSGALDISRPRQLSFIFDIVDAYFIALCVRIGIPHFLSFTHYLFTTLIGIISWFFFVQKLKMNRQAALLLILIFYFSPAMLFATYFRTAKIGAGLMIAIVICAVCQGGAKVRRKWWVHLLGTCTLAICACSAMFFDEQGVSIIGAVLIALIVLAIKERTCDRLFQCLAVGTAILFYGLFCIYLYPHLVLKATGSLPDFDWQSSIPWNYAIRPENIEQGMLLFADTIRFLYGNITVYQVIVVVGGALVFALFLRRTSFLQRQGLKKAVGLLPLTFVVATIAFCVAMNTVMYVRHTPLGWPDLRRVYYWIPTVVGVILLAPWLFRKVLMFKAEDGRKPIVVLMLLVFLLGGNLLAIPEHKAIIWGGHLNAEYSAAPLMLDSLRNIHNPGHEVPPEIASNGIYKLLAAFAHAR